MDRSKLIGAMHTPVAQFFWPEIFNHFESIGRNMMSEIRMTGEIRTDYDCEASGLPAERWAESVFQIGEEEIVLEISVEDDTIVAIMAGEDAAWKGTLEGLKKLLKGEIKAR